MQSHEPDRARSAARTDLRTPSPDSRAEQQAEQSISISDAKIDIAPAAGEDAYIAIDSTPPESAHAAAKLAADGRPRPSSNSPRRTRRTRKREYHGQDLIGHECDVCGASGDTELFVSQYFAGELRCEKCRSIADPGDPDRTPWDGTWESQDPGSWSNLHLPGP
eukprot:tig00000405_g456.t1